MKSNLQGVHIFAYGPEYYTGVESFLCSQVESTPYHHPVWLDIYGSTFGHKPISWVAIDDIGRVAGYFPCFLMRWPAKRLVSFPHRDRGGPVAVDENTERCLFDHMMQAGTMASARYLKIRGIGQCLEERWKKWGGEVASPRITVVKQLPPPNHDVRETGIDESLKRALRVAGQSGLAFEDVSKDISAWAVFYAMFLHTRKRLGAPSYPWSFFAALCRMAVPAGICRLFIARKEDRPCAGMVVMLTKHVAIYAYGASDMETWNWRPNDFLIWKILQWCADRGIDAFDFGADQRDQESLIRFKAKWNGSRANALEAVWALAGKPSKARVPAHGGITSRLHRHLPLWALRVESRIVFRLVD